MLSQLAAILPTKVAEKAKQYGLDVRVRDERLAAAEEVLAELAQTRPTSTWVQRSIAAIRTWLRENVPGLADMKMTEAEVIRNFIVPAREFVERGKAKNGRASPAFRFAAVKQVWYSALAQQVEKSAMKSIPVGAWTAAVKNWVSTGKVKTAEVEWSGLGDWLAMQPGKINKAQVSEFLSANGVQVEETILGAAGLHNDAPEWGALNDEHPTGTKYGDRVLPGGTNYRELLLTLPARTRDATLPEVNAARRKVSALLEPITQEQYAALAAEGELPRVAVDPDAASYKSSHWEQSNVLAHIRVKALLFPRLPPVRLNFFDK